MFFPKNLKFTPNYLQISLKIFVTFVLVLSKFRKLDVKVLLFCLYQLKIAGKEPLQEEFNFVQLFWCVLIRGYICGFSIPIDSIFLVIHFGIFFKNGSQSMQILIKQVKPIVKVILHDVGQVGCKFGNCVIEGYRLQQSTQSLKLSVWNNAK